MAFSCYDTSGTGGVPAADDEAAAPEQPSRAPLLPAPAHAPPSPETRIFIKDLKAAGPGDEDLRSRGPLATVSPDDSIEILRPCGLVDTRLHSAARAQDLAALRALLGAGAAPDALDREGRTPLHLCVVLRLIEPFKVLLSVPGSADARDASGWPLLHAALLHGWRAGARAALTAGARVDITFVPNGNGFKIHNYPEDRYPDIEENVYLSSLHQLTIEIAMDSGDMVIFEMVLTAAVVEGVVDRQNEYGQTALYTAIRKRNLPAIQALLKKGASPHKISDKDDSALHLAVHYPNILKYFLDNTDVKFSQNKDGLNPMHLAAYNNKLESLKLLLDKFSDTASLDELVLHFAVVADSDDAVRFILEKEPRLLAMSEYYQPLHTAARRHSRKVVALMLEEGCLLSDKDPKAGQTILEMISCNIYDPLNFFKDDVFDKNICCHEEDVDKVSVDYEVLTRGAGMSQINVLEEFIRCGQSKVLIHPLIESLVYLKWTQFLPLFYALISVYTIFLVSVNVFVVGVFYNDYTNNSTADSTAESPGAAGGLHAGLYWLLIVLIYGSTVILLLQESLFIYAKGRRYFACAQSWVKLCGLVLCAGAPLAALAPGAWPRHAACAALLLAWLQAMFLVSHDPRWGYYVLMFGIVAANILKILLTAIFLVIAFASCFMIQYRSAPPFDGPFAAIVKTLVMMSSEFEYEGLFGDDHKEQLRETDTVVRLLFVVFVIFVAIVLMNFMIGVAVSDISDLIVTGNIRRLEQQVKLLSTFEALANQTEKLFGNNFGAKRHYRKIETERGHSSSTWVAYCQRHPDASSEEDIKYPIQIRSATLYNAIMDTALRNDEEAKENTRVTTFRYKVDALYDAIVDNPVATASIEENKRIGKRKEIREEKKDMNSISLRRLITNQNEQMKSLVDDLTKVSHENEEIKNCIKELSVKVGELASNMLQ